MSRSTISTGTYNQYCHGLSWHRPQNRTACLSHRSTSMFDPLAFLFIVCWLLVYKVITVPFGKHSKSWTIQEPKKTTFFVVLSAASPKEIAPTSHLSNLCKQMQPFDAVINFVILVLIENSPDEGSVKVCSYKRETLSLSVCLSVSYTKL
jgi:hypothetical protein